MTLLRLILIYADFILALLRFYSIVENKDFLIGRCPSRTAGQWSRARPVSFIQPSYPQFASSSRSYQLCGRRWHLWFLVRWFKWHSCLTFSIRGTTRAQKPVELSLTCRLRFYSTSNHSAWLLLFQRVAFSHHQRIPVGCCKAQMRPASVGNG